MDEGVERRAREIFLAALELPPEARRSYVDSRADDDPDGAQRALQLLDAHETENQLFTSVRAGGDGALSEFLLDAYLHASERPDDQWDPPDLSGALVGGRFEVADLIGQGRFGAVYAAVDQLTSAAVAVKVLLGPEAVRSVAAPRERIALLALDVPGVVRLLDSGVFEGRPYLVTEYFPGEPFPGTPGPLPWDRVLAPTIALLEALARVHAAGVVHGDLKPDNVLVSTDGELRLVDLGVAVGEAIAHTGSMPEAWGGTVPFLAPELCRAGADGPTVASDLYAVGVMLFNALTGAIPHESADREALMRRRASGPSDLGALSELRLPASARRLISSLLEMDPTRRPATAADALAALTGARPPVEHVARRVEAVLAEGAHGDQSALRSLFAGPDRLLHIRKDAEQLLWDRTGGELQAVIDELSRWVRGGLARVRGDAVVLTRDALARIENLAPPEGQELGSADALPSPESALVLDLVTAAGAHARVEWLAAAADWTHERMSAELDLLRSVGLVESLSGGVFRAVVTAPGWASPARRLAADVALADALPEGAVGRLRHLIGAGRLDEIAPDVMALAAHQSGLGDVAGARAAIAHGLTILRAAGRPAEEEAQLVRVLLEASVAEGTERALSLAAYEAERSESAGVRLNGGLALARAALRAVQGDGRGALALANSVRIDVKDVLLELRRQSVRVFAAQFVDLQYGESIMRSACAWAEPYRASDERVAGELFTWESGLAYRSGRYVEAMERARSALRLARSHRTSIIALLDSSAAAIEAYELEIAQDDALQARDRAGAARHPAYEARAEVRLRAAMYRSEEDAPLDTELIEAVRVIADAPTRATILLTEAAVGWRRGELDVARELASESANVWRDMGVLDVADLADALAAACGDTDVAACAEQVLDRVASYPRPGIAAQILGLHAVATGGLRAPRRELLQQLASQLPDAPRDRRREVLSIDECLRFAGC